MPSLINDLIYRPEWFIPTESVFEIVSMFVTFIISFYSYKVYHITNNKKYKYLSIGFFGMALGFLFKTLSNSVILYYDFFVVLDKLIPYFRISYVYTGSLVLYAFLILSGYIVLTCLTVNIRNRRIILSFLFIALLASILIRQARSFTFFYFFAFVLLVVYIVPYMYINYNKQKSNNSFLVFLSFFLLAISNFVLMGLGVYRLELYIIGQAIGLLAYIILLTNLVLVLKK